MEGEAAPKKEPREPVAERLIPVLALAICGAIGLYFAVPYARFLFPTSHVSAKSPIAVAVNRARQVILCLRLYSADHDGNYPAKIEDLVAYGVITQAEWDKIKNFELAADGKPRPWDVSLDLNDTEDAALPLVVSPMPTKEGTYIMGMNDGSVTTTRKKADFDAVMERLKEHREAKAALSSGAPAVAAPASGAPPGPPR